MKVLVAEDNAQNRDLLGWILEDQGHTVFPAANGADAVSCFEAESIDLILMDIMMPVMDGYDATLKIRALEDTNNHTPIIFLTALSDTDSLAKCISAGGDDFLIKPFHERILEAKMRAHTRIKELTDHVRDQNEELTRLNSRLLAEQEVAKSVFEKALASNNQCPNVRSYLSAANEFNGDIFLSAPSQNGGLYLLLADLTGHGLHAALGTLPISQIFFRCTENGESLSNLTRELNKNLQHFLPDYMYAASALLEIKPNGTTVNLWHGGLPEMLIVDTKGRFRQASASCHMPLGVLSDDEFEPEIKTLELLPDEKLYIYTDGIIETRNNDGAYFGLDRLHDLLNGEKKDNFAAILNAVAEFSGNEEQQDDLTLIEYTARPLRKRVRERKKTDYTIKHSLDTHIELTLHPQDIRSVSPVLHLTELLNGIPAARDDLDYINAILSEMYSNALEHGLLGLNSTIKQTREGYYEYYKIRSERLRDLQNGEIHFDIRLEDNKERPLLHIVTRDSGSGFDFETHISADNADEDSIYGRGLPIIKGLCNTMYFSDGGRSIHADYQLGSH